MGLSSNETLEAFVKRIVSNEKIMNIMQLPTINSTDSEEVIKQKRNILINNFISKTAQIPYELGTSFEDVEIDKKKYSDFGKIRITISLAQAIKLNHDLFNNPQVDINIYYDNTKIEDVFKLLDLISDEFSGKDLIIEGENEKNFIRNIRCEGTTAQTAIINNYERVGLRFSFFATVYKI